MTKMKPSNRQIKRRLSDPSGNPPKYLEATTLPPSDFEDGDSDLISAAEVLTQLTRSDSTHSHDTSTVASPISASSFPDFEQPQHPIVQRVNAVSRLPIVTNAVRYYELSKRNYATFNYAAAMVEKAAMPVFSKIEVNLNNKHKAKLEQARIKKKRRIARTKDRTEMKKRLKFCLHILKLANDNISAKVVDLQQKIQDREIEALERKREQHVKDSEINESIKDEKSNKENSESTETTLNIRQKSESVEPAPEAQKTKTEIVATVKKIIHVILNFRPSSLDAGKPEEAKEGPEAQLKSTIRKIIFDLPKQIQQTGDSQSSDRIVVFAKESLDMISRLTTVFSEQLEKADRWVDGDEKRKTVQQVRSPLDSLDDSLGNRG